MPRNRTARLAVLGSSVQRSSSAPYTSRSTSALRRRIVVGILILVSLALITVYFRESSTGGLHSVQAAGATVLRPFEVGAERLARPFRDVYGYFDGLVAARAENRRLQKEVDQLRLLDTQKQGALQQNATLTRLLDYRDGPRFPNDYRAVTAAVISHPPSQFQQEVVIAAGSSDGVRENDPVVTEDGLVGDVTAVTSRTARVTLLTDERSAVSAADLASRTKATGILQHGPGDGDSLVLTGVTKDNVVYRGDRIVTAGSRQGSLPSLYPRGIQIGRVTRVGQNDIDPFKQIQVDPFVNFSSLGAVIVLVPTKPVPQAP